MEQGIQREGGANGEGSVTLADVIATASLKAYTPRAPDFKAENEALRSLALTLSHSPEDLACRLVELALKLTGAGSAGLSLQDTKESSPVFRWVATAGEYGRYLNGTLPRYFSPCGVVVDRNESLLMRAPERLYPYICDLHCPVREVLLAPFSQSGIPIGTIWVVHHDDDHHFDVEDLRIVQSLTSFAAAAVGTVKRFSDLQASNKDNQEQLEVSRQQNKLLAQWFEHTPGFMALLRWPDYVFEMANRSYFELIGPRSIVGKPLLEALPEVAGQGFIELLDEVVRTKTAYVGNEVPVQLHRPNGNGPVKAYLDFVYQPVLNDHGVVSAIFVQGHDVTSRRRSMDLLKEADARKDEFLTVVAHEMRNPLAPIKVSARILKLKLKDSEYTGSIDIIERQVNQLSTLIEDLLDAASIRAGKITLDIAPVRIQEVIARAIEVSQPQIERLGHQLQVSVPEEPIVIGADVSRLTQVIGNLLSNAAKYTPVPGAIALYVEKLADSVQVHVQDTGLGISSEMLPLIFDMFMQVPSTLRKVGGLGIGLALVRKLVELHGGTVEAHSAGLGKGSRFTVRLPTLIGIEAMEVGGLAQ